MNDAVSAGNVADDPTADVGIDGGWKVTAVSEVGGGLYSVDVSPGAGTQAGGRYVGPYYCSNPPQYCGYNLCCSLYNSNSGSGS